MTTKEKLQYVESYYEKMGNLYLADPEHIQDFHIVIHYLHLLLKEELNIENGETPLWGVPLREKCYFSNRNEILRTTNSYLFSYGLPLNEGDERSLMVRYLRNYCELFSHSKPESRFEPVMNIQSPFLHEKARQLFDEMKAEPLSNEQVYEALFYANICGVNSDVNALQILINERRDGQVIVKPLSKS